MQQQLHMGGLIHGSIQLLSTSHSSLTQPSVLLVSTYLGVCGPHWTDFELVRVDVQLILFIDTRPQTRLAYVEAHDRQWIISSSTVQSHDFPVVSGYYIKPMTTLFRGWAHQSKPWKKNLTWRNVHSREMQIGIDHLTLTRTLILSLDFWTRNHNAEDYYCVNFQVIVISGFVFIVLIYPYTHPHTQWQSSQYHKHSCDMWKCSFPLPPKLQSNVLSVRIDV